jgi:hypothetical protein
MPADFLTTKFRIAALHMADFHAAAGASTLEEEGTDEHEPSRPTGRGLGAASPCVGGDLRLARAGDLGQVRRCRCSILTRPIQIFYLVSMTSACRGVSQILALPTAVPQNLFFLT